jgi:hypothetical protein
VNDIAITIGMWVLIIIVTLFARAYLQHTFRLPTDRDRIRSWRYRRAVRLNIKRRYHR